MKNYLFTLLFLLCFKASAGFEAIGASLSSTTQFDGFCQQEVGQWVNCTDTSAALPGTYQHLFYSETTQESVAFGFYDNDQGYTSFMAACKAKDENAWRNCTPDPAHIPVGDYDQYIDPAHDGQGGFVVVGDGENYSVIAACRHANGEWYNCSPMENTEDFFVATLNYTNDQWIALSARDRTVEGYTIIPALCMDHSSSWQNCDLTVNNTLPNDSFTGSTLKGIQYVPASAQWTGLHLGYINGLDGLYLRSFCRNARDSVWNDCTDGIFASNGAENFIQNERGELLVINQVLSGISLSSTHLM